MVCRFEVEEDGGGKHWRGVIAHLAKGLEDAGILRGYAIEIVEAVTNGNSKSPFRIISRSSTEMVVTKVRFSSCFEVGEMA